MSDQSTPVTRLPLRKGASLRWLPFLFIFLQSVLYGLGDPISKSAYEVLPVYSLLTARYGIALAFLLLVFGRRIWRGLKVCSPRDWLLPSLCMGGAYVANNIALELTAATHSRMITAPRIPGVESCSPRRRRENMAVITGQKHWSRATVREESTPSAAFWSR